MKMIIDPVCKMKLDKTDPIKTKVSGRNYFFCGLECKEEFESSPEKFSCPECGKICDIEKTIHKIKHKDKIYVFCSKKHKNQFQLKHFKEIIY